MKATVRVAETLITLQGEASLAGYPCFLIRLAGCPLDCSYCDTPQAKEEGTQHSVEVIVAKTIATKFHHVLVTGGEPLHQTFTTRLLRRLCDELEAVSASCRVVLETSGSLPINDVDPRVRVVLDVKCPGSGMADKTHWPNLERLRERDEVKLVLTDRADYDYASDVIARHRLIDRSGNVILSPVAGQLDAEELARWMLDDRLPVRLGLQLHKLAWPGLG